MSETGGGRLTLIGIGPDGAEHITLAAARALREADTVVGYSAYVNQVRRRLRGKQVLDRAIGLELERAQEAIELACQGRQVALISGGDAGVYGMAAPLFETLEARGWRPGDPPEVCILPGVSAAQAAAAALGAPLMHDFATISLSDLLTPWDTILRRVEAAAGADFVLAFYNPASQKRAHQLGAALNLVRRFRDGATPVAFVRDAGRATEVVRLSSLDAAVHEVADMRTIVIVGNSQTRWLGSIMLTPRGYSPRPES